jgi:ribosomal protein L24E|tara:strand:+ start:771 stop:1070 length:300 start_codon:yes stop_codon:yes gene_type:complete
MPKCSFCGTVYENPRGLSLVLTDGSLKHLCSSKCRKNFQMKRRKNRWIIKMKKTKAEIAKEHAAELEEEVSEKVPEVVEKKEKSVGKEISEKKEEKAGK